MAASKLQSDDATKSIRIEVTIKSPQAFMRAGAAGIILVSVTVCPDNT